ncbi:MAG: GAF domain-containing protein, partial [Candidatus Hydrogenedentes bacterium]|nr:GAF domain-containing protein [Candidatus Hydrogenedentota bacterium]
MQPEIWTDSNQKIVSANDGFLDITGYTLDELVGERPAILKSGLHSNAFYKTMRSSIDSMGIWSGVIINNDKQGRRFSVQLLVTTERASDGTVSGYHGVYEKILSIPKSFKTTEELRIQQSILTSMQTATTVDDVLEKALQAIATMSELRLQNKLGAFLVDEEGKGLRLAKVLGDFSDEFLEREAMIPIGACLCGRVALSGEVLVSDCCFRDCRHEHVYEDMTEHGHYIIPITHAGNVLGVIFLYTDSNPSHDQFRVDVLQSIGVLVGTSIHTIRQIEGKEKTLRASETRYKELA